MPSLNAMFKLYDGYSKTINIVNRKTDEATNKILKASGATDTLNNKMKSAGAGAGILSSGLGRVVSIAALAAGALKGMNITDEFTNTSARLSLINDGLQTQAELQEKIFDAADRSKGSYTAMAGAISKMGITASEAFGSNDELIAFTELIQKGFKVGGASTTEQSSAMLQLTQAMGAGKLQGDEFRSIMENAPMIADAIAKYTGKSKGELKELSSQGLITSDIIKNAVFMAADGVDGINAKFKTMPMTFADIWNRIKNGGLEAFAPLIQATSRLINSDGFNAVVDGFLTGINLISAGIGGLINFIADNWPIIQSLLLATGIYLAVTLGPGFIAAGIAGMTAGLQIAAGWIMANLPMLAVIATLAMIIYGLQQAGVTVEDIFGFIGGFIGATVAFIWNLFLVFFDSTLELVNQLINPFINFANFLGNVFTNPISSIIYMFQGMADGILGVLENIAQAMDFVFGSNMADSVASWRSGLKDMADTAVAKYAPNENYQKIIDNINLDTSTFGMDRMNYGESWNAGSKISKGVYGGIDKTISGFLDKFSNNGKDKGFDMADFGTGKPIKIEGTGKNKKVDVDMSDEDLKYLRDIAERDYINKFSTATLAPNVTFNISDIKETADLNKIKGTLEMMMREEIAVAAEGAY